MTSPLLGVAAQNSFLFTAFSLSKRLVNPAGPHLSVGQVAIAGGMAGAANSLVASPVELLSASRGRRAPLTPEIQMQSQVRLLLRTAAHDQYGGATDMRLSEYAMKVWRDHGLRHGIMRGFWVCCVPFSP